MPSIQQKQQVIRSMIQNFDWETNPNWQDSIDLIADEIRDYWHKYKA